jgi:hypothetical protein
MRGLLPGILGDLMVVSGLNEGTADKMSPLMGKTLMGKIYSVDVQIAGGSINFNTSPESGLKMLADAHWNAVRPLHNDLAQTIHSITGLASLSQNLSKGVANSE